MAGACRQARETANARERLIVCADHEQGGGMQGGKTQCVLSVLGLCVRVRAAAQPKTAQGTTKNC